MDTRLFLVYQYSLMVRVMMTVQNLLSDPRCSTETKREARIRSLRICVLIETKSYCQYGLQSYNQGQIV